MKDKDKIETDEIISDENSKHTKTAHCSNCGELVPIDELVVFPDSMGLSKKMLCKKCRLEEGYETEDDIIEILSNNLKTAPEIYNYLNQYVVGQDEAKRVLSVEIRNHYLRIINQNSSIPKNSILLTGTSGSGKTYLVETLAKLLDVPYVSVSAKNFSETGYSGENIESILLNLLMNARLNLVKAKYGIIFIDEIDKIAKAKDSHTRDVSGAGVQQSLLKLIEGSNVRVPLGPGEPTIQMDTSNILFICGGAFESIEEIVEKRLNIDKNKHIGFTAENFKKDKLDKTSLEYKNKIRSAIITDDLIEFGMLAEFVGRFSTICNLSTLNQKQLVQILQAKGGTIEKYKNLFKLENKKLIFEKTTLDLIASEAIRKNIGARGITGVLSNYMNDLMFNLSLEDKDLYKITRKSLEKYYNEHNNINNII